MVKNTLEENLFSSVICFTLHIAAHRKSCRQHTCCLIHFMVLLCFDILYYAITLTLFQMMTT